MSVRCCHVIAEVAVARSGQGSEEGTKVCPFRKLGEVENGADDNIKSKAAFLYSAATAALPLIFLEILARGIA